MAVIVYALLDHALYQGAAVMPFYVSLLIWLKAFFFSWHASLVGETPQDSIDKDDDITMGPLCNYYNRTHQSKQNSDVCFRSVAVAQRLSREWLLSRAKQTVRFKLLLDNRPGPGSVMRKFSMQTFCLAIEPRNIMPNHSQSQKFA